MIITIGGSAGTGTTTVCHLLSQKTGMPYISAGDIFREMAAERDMSVLEFSKYAEGNLNVDKEIDQRQAQIAKENKDIIVEGRLSAYFVEADLRIWFKAPLDVRAERIAQREDKNKLTVKNEILIREKSEAKRYQEIHHLDIGDMDIYDLIISTHKLPPESIAEIILKMIEVISCLQ